MKAIITLVVLLAAGGSQARNWNPYYPAELVQSYNNQQLNNESLKQKLHQLVRKAVVVTDHGFVKGIAEQQRNTLSYKEARRHLFGRLHLDQTNNNRYFVRDVYCNKIYTNRIGPRRIPSANEINCEHTWPQSRFTRRFPKNVQKTDLHHLYPTASFANSTRSSFIFAEVEGEAVAHDCQASKFGFAVDSGERAFEPPDEHKGNVARAIFYFSVRYKTRIPATEERYLKKWHQQDPVDDFERWRNNEIHKLQRNRNPFIDKPELVFSINDF